MNIVADKSDIDVDDMLQMKDAIRHARFPDSPMILHLHLDAVDACTEEQNSAKKIKVYTDLLDLLLDVYSDSFLPTQWRQLCLNHCYKPLMEMKKISTTHFIQQRHKFRVLSHYFH